MTSRAGSFHQYGAHPHHHLMAHPHQQPGVYHPQHVMAAGGTSGSHPLLPHHSPGVSGIHPGSSSYHHHSPAAISGGSHHHHPSIGGVVGGLPPSIGGGPSSMAAAHGGEQMMAGSIHHPHHPQQASSHPHHPPSHHHPPTYHPQVTSSHHPPGYHAHAAGHQTVGGGVMSSTAMQQEGGLVPGLPPPPSAAGVHHHSLHPSPQAGGVSPHPSYTNHASNGFLGVRGRENAASLYAGGATANGSASPVSSGEVLPHPEAFHRDYVGGERSMEVPGGVAHHPHHHPSHHHDHAPPLAGNPSSGSGSPLDHAWASGAAAHHASVMEHHQRLNSLDAYGHSAYHAHGGGMLLEQA